MNAAQSVSELRVRGSSHFYIKISGLAKMCDSNLDFSRMTGAECGLQLPNRANRTMWLPSPIYERVPQFWLLLGLLFFAFGLYLGFEFNLIFVYLGIGLLCIGRSAWIFQARHRHRLQKDSDSAEEHSDQAPIY